MRGPSLSAQIGITTLLVLSFFALGTANLRAAEVMPPKPAGYFNDYAGVVSQQAASRFNEELAQFERDTSNQVLVAVYRKMETDSDIADYTQRIAQSWGVGQADKRNGAVLFVFVETRKMFIQVGYGLEGVLPDATAFDITERHIKPYFRNQNYQAGLATGIDLIQKAVRGEYKGGGKTVAEGGSGKSKGDIPCVFIFFLFIFVLLMMGRFSRKNRRRGWGYSGRGGPFIGGWGGGGGGWSGGSSSGGGFSGFSGGGGSFGGGGGGSSW